MEGVKLTSFISEGNYFVYSIPFLYLCCLLVMLLIFFLKRKNLCKRKNTIKTAIRRGLSLWDLYPVKIIFSTWSHFFACSWLTYYATDFSYLKGKILEKGSSAVSEAYESYIQWKLFCLLDPIFVFLLLNYYATYFSYLKEKSY